MTLGQPLITAARFDLRPLRVSDAGLIALHTGDKRVAQMTGSIPHPLPPGAVEAYIASVQAPDRTQSAWAMDASRLGGAEVQGVVLLKHVDHDASEIGFWVAPQIWNSGLASEAVRALIEANPRASRVIYATVFQDNAASARVLTKCGFQHLGNAEGFCVARDATLPTWTYSLKCD
ncbi:GNAT family N-acetyltransferase [Roseovarius sp. LXJ103]|nr:GNAT family N-acetyltransferase [Roseovarius carneus]PWE37212.1 GNAT family N-acetyltransferase [Pelagicola sp. LXJ1103]